MGDPHVPLGDPSDPAAGPGPADPAVYYWIELAEAQGMALELAWRINPPWAGQLESTNLLTADTAELYAAFSPEIDPVFDDRHVPRSWAQLLGVAVGILAVSRSMADQGGEQMAAEQVFTALDQLYRIADALGLPTDGRTGTVRARHYQDLARAARAGGDVDSAIDSFGFAEPLSAPAPQVVTARSPRTEAVVDLSVPGTAAQRAYEEQLLERWNASATDARVQELRRQIVLDGRRAALDLRLVGRERDGAGKLEAVADTVASMLAQTDALHLVFCDETQRFRPAAQDLPITVDRHLLDLLVERGIPAQQIRLTRQARFASDIYRIAEQADAGTATVLIGSTWRLARLPDLQVPVAVHHVDVPENVPTLRARESHATGSEAAVVVSYRTEGTAEPFTWQQLRRSAAGTPSATIEEVMALAAGPGVPHWSERGSLGALTDAQLASALLDARGTLALALQAAAASLPTHRFDERAIESAARETFPELARLLDRNPQDASTVEVWHKALETVRREAGEHAAAGVAEEMARAVEQARAAVTAVATELRHRAHLPPARRTEEHAERAAVVKSARENLADTGLTSSNASAQLPVAGDDRSARYGL